jgi:hypothetical protein
MGRGSKKSIFFFLEVCTVQVKDVGSNGEVSKQKTMYLGFIFCWPVCIETSGF